MQRIASFALNGSANNRLCPYAEVFRIKPSHWDSMESKEIEQILFFILFNFIHFLILFTKNWFTLKPMMKICAAFFNGFKKQRKKNNVAIILFLSKSKTVKKLTESCSWNSFTPEMNFNDYKMLSWIIAECKFCTKKKKMDKIWRTKYDYDYEIPYSKLPQCDQIIGITFAYRL